jgi:hypothetical protein
MEWVVSVTPRPLWAFVAYSSLKFSPLSLNCVYSTDMIVMRLTLYLVWMRSYSTCVKVCRGLFYYSISSFYLCDIKEHHDKYFLVYRVSLGCLNCCTNKYGTLLGYICWPVPFSNLSCNISRLWSRNGCITSIMETDLMQHKVNSDTVLRMSFSLYTWARQLYHVSSGNSRRSVRVDEHDYRVHCTVCLFHIASHFIVLCDTSQPLKKILNFVTTIPPPSGRTGRLRRISCNIQCQFLFSCPFHYTNAVISAALIQTFLIVDGAQFSHFGALIRPTLFAVFRSKLHKRSNFAAVCTAYPTASK